MSREIRPALNDYERGETAYNACLADQRFGYYLYVPTHFSFESATSYRLVVLVHGTNRTPQIYRSLFAPFAEEHRCVVLTPLFPVGIIEPRELNNYKFIKFHDIRYDLVLLAMIEEVASRYGLDARRFLLHGFSGGGHFAHRFFYLHPRRLSGVSIGAPGMVTLLDERQDWHCGVRDFEEQFGVSLDYASMRAVPVQTVIGAEDTDTTEITIAPDSRLWMEGVNDAGRTRLDRISSLRASLERAGIQVRHDVVAGVAHQGYEILEPVKAFFASILNV
ncbi:alpha/beta hydrolase [Steroidobacter flavus]|uniref:Alpha/beta hydrolase n=1 Tax=Steroidobacter flavus TaxID=1842136 RepID=A0ABV8SZQ3_9GAMM